MCNKLFTGWLLLAFVNATWAQDSEQESAESEQNSKRPSWSAGLPERQKTTGLNKPEFKPDRDNKIDLDMSEFGLQKKPDIEIDLPINADIADIPVNESDTAIQNIEVESESVQSVIENTGSESIAQNEEPESITDQEVKDTSTEEQPIAAEPVAESDEELVEEVPALSVNETVSTDSTPSVQEADTLLEQQSLASIDSPVGIESDYMSLAVEEPDKYNWNILTRTPLKYPVKAAKESLEGWVEVEITINSAGEVVSAEAINYSRRGKVFSRPAIQSVNNWLFEPPINVGITNNLTRVYRVEFEL